MSARKPRSRRGSVSEALKSVYASFKLEREKTKHDQLLDDSNFVDDGTTTFIVKGVATKETFTIEFTDQYLKVFHHDTEDGTMTLVDSVIYRLVKSFSAPSQTSLVIDWHRGAYKVEEISRFETRAGDAKKMQHRFFERVDDLIIRNS